MFLEISLIFLVPLLFFLLFFIFSFFIFQKQEKTKLHNFSLLFQNKKNIINKFYLKYNFLKSLLPFVIFPLLFSLIIYVIWLWITISANVQNSEKVLFISFNIIFAIITISLFFLTIFINLKIFKVKNEFTNFHIYAYIKNTELLEIEFCDGTYINIKNKILHKKFKKLQSIINTNFSNKKSIIKFLVIYTNIIDFFIPYFLLNKEQISLNAELKLSPLHQYNNIFENASFKLTKNNKKLSPLDVYKIFIEFYKSLDANV